MGPQLLPPFCGVSEDCYIFHISSLPGLGKHIDLITIALLAGLIGGIIGYDIARKMRGAMI